MTTGRNFDEVLRVIDRCSSPPSTGRDACELEEGEDVIIAGSVTDDEAKQHLPRGLEVASAIPADRAAARQLGLLYGFGHASRFIEQLEVPARDGARAGRRAA